MIATILDTTGNYSTIQLRDLAARRLIEEYQNLSLEAALIIAGQSIDELQTFRNYVQESLISKIVLLSEKRIRLQDRVQAQQII